MQYGEVSNATQAARAAELLERTGDISNALGADARAIIDASPADRIVRAEYHRPYETHARMEPINATVSVTPERVDVWSPAQNQATPLLLVADQLGRDPRDIHVHTRSPTRPGGSSPHFVSRPRSSAIAASYGKMARDQRHGRRLTYGAGSVRSQRGGAGPGGRDGSGQVASVVRAAPSTDETCRSGRTGGRPLRSVSTIRSVL